VSRVLIALAVVVTALTSARAEDFSDLAQFAQSICGDIPEGSLTRTSIQGKVGANAGVYAKLISGGADVTGSRAEVIYKGIPFDKLPDNIPTVSMCKIELVKILKGQSIPGLQRIEGRWNQTGTNIQITKSEIEGWDIWLSKVGRGRIGSTSGHGANVQVSTAQFECYYFLTRLSDGKALQWQKTSGPSVCPEGRFERPSSTRYPSTPPVVEPKGFSDIHNPWVALSDVGADSDGFFDRSPGQKAQPLTVGPSDVLSANRDINMRKVPAGWGQAQILHKGQRVRVIATRSLPAAGTWQVWAQISVIE
jgi:hypothetical protein